MKKSPAFLFYPKDWISDIKVRLMTPSQRGYYIDLLSYMWLEGGFLPLDVEVLMSITGASKNDISVVTKCFKKSIIDGEEVYTQKRMYEQVEKQRDRREQAQSAANIRWNKEKPAPIPKKHPRIQTNEQKIKKALEEFKAELREFYNNNPNKYSTELYIKFIDWWGIPGNIKNPSKLVYQKEKSWNLAARLKTFGDRQTMKNSMNNEANVKADVIKPIVMD